MRQKSLKIALALFVKDEFSDIAGWIAWHAALGVTTFFVYDDYSSDGTWEILQAAARCHDVRLKRTDPSAEPNFYNRQGHSFMEAAQECRGNYDWLGFLDGDEYLYLRHFDNLSDFLRGFEHADAIAFSWRIHGSANRVVRPKLTTVEVFTQHSTEELGDNAHIKSLVRPDKMGDEYSSPHWFDVAKERYARPSGKYVDHAGPIQEIEWSDGFVMHYICRSMEHYIQRIKRRLNADLLETHGYWDHFNRNNVNDTAPLALIPRVVGHIGPIHDEMVKSAILKIKAILPYMRDSSETVVVQRSKGENSNISVFRIRSHFQTCLFYSLKLATVVHVEEDHARREGLLEIVGAIDPATPDLITFHVTDREGISIRFPNDFRVMQSVLFRLKPQADNRFAFMCPLREEYMAFVAPEDGVGAIHVNRHKAGEWEYVMLEPLRLPSSKAFAFPLPFMPDQETSLGDIVGWIRDAPSLPSNDEFLRVLHAVSPSVRAEVSRYVPGLLWNALS